MWSAPKGQIGACVISLPWLVVVLHTGLVLSAISVDSRYVPIEYDRGGWRVVLGLEVPFEITACFSHIKVLQAQQCGDITFER